MAKIKHDSGDPDAWVCHCGNTPCGDGFYSCDRNGREVEPVEGQWDGCRYVCNGCGVIIDQATLEIVGQGIPPHKLEAPAVN